MSDGYLFFFETLYTALSGLQPDLNQAGTELAEIHQLLPPTMVYHYAQIIGNFILNYLSCKDFILCHEFNA